MSGFAQKSAKNRERATQVRKVAESDKQYSAGLSETKLRATLRRLSKIQSLAEGEQHLCSCSTPSASHQLFAVFVGLRLRLNPTLYCLSPSATFSKLFTVFSDFLNIIYRFRRLYRYFRAPTVNALYYSLCSFCAKLH
ncbi:MAG TPA: hypothetical protein VGC76_20350 [Pyrinomonadaceae bacterium]